MAASTLRARQSDRRDRRNSLTVANDVMGMEPKRTWRDVGQAQAERRMVLLLQRRLAMVRAEQDARIQPFVEQYAARLVRSAARMVGAQDAPDVAQAAFESFTCWLHRRPITEARQLLESHEDLWRLMLSITSRRAVTQ